MLSESELKQKYLEEFSKNNEKYYPDSIKKLGFVRKKCSLCSRNFWSVNERKICGDSKCEKGYSFINNTPAKKKISYTNIWKQFSKVMKKNGYSEVKRYPVVARWRDDLHFVEASIDPFIPYVVNGQVKPSANPLIIPQPCLRFNDIDNVGITGSHYSCFVMIGQLAFEPPESYTPNEYILHLLKWFTDGMKIPLEEMIIHEDIWTGSGNFGPSMEFFSRGIELANQVYMQFNETETGRKKLKVNVLDMGLGQERNAWFSNGQSTSYESVFPTVLKYIRNNFNFSGDSKLYDKFLPYASLLNIDEIKNISDMWKLIGKQLETDPEVLKKSVLEHAAVYSVAEHTRSFLFALNDGSLPSNTGGGYNIRVLLRRVLSLMEKYGIEADISKICELHSKYLKMFPNLKKLAFKCFRNN